MNTKEHENLLKIMPNENEQYRKYITLYKHEQLFLKIGSRVHYLKINPCNQPPQQVQ